MVPFGLALLAAVTEALWMRALLFRLLWRVVGPRWALAAVAVVFAALHLANPGANVLAGATVATGRGDVLRAVSRSPGGSGCRSACTLAWNLAQGYLFGAAVSGGDLGGSLAVSTARAGRTPPGSPAAPSAPRPRSSRSCSSRP